jgi:hypothetical protein
MRILAIITGEYGRRHVENIRLHGPASWNVEIWQAPVVFPLVIDYPEDYLPTSLPSVDLLLSFAEHKGVAELIPDIAKMTGARAVIAAIDNEAWLPRGLAHQLHGWLKEMGIACATPKPLCSLTDTDYGVSHRQKERYDNPLIAELLTTLGSPNSRSASTQKTARSARLKCNVMQSAAALATWRKGWWASQWMKPRKKPGCSTTTTPAWQACSSCLSSITIR